MPVATSKRLFMACKRRVVDPNHLGVLGVFSILQKPSVFFVTGLFAVFVCSHRICRFTNLPLGFLLAHLPTPHMLPPQEIGPC